MGLVGSPPRWGMVTAGVFPRRRGGRRLASRLREMGELLPNLLGGQDAPDGGPHRIRVALALPLLRWPQCSATSMPMATSSAEAHSASHWLLDSRSPCCGCTAHKTRGAMSAMSSRHTRQPKAWRSRASLISTPSSASRPTETPRAVTPTLPAELNPTPREGNAAQTNVAGEDNDFLARRLIRVEGLLEQAQRELAAVRERLRPHH